MTTSAENHGIVSLSLLFLLLSPRIILVGAQSDPPTTNNGDQYPDYARFTPSMVIIVVVLIAALFFMGFFSIYIRHCADVSGAAGSIRRALSHRAAAARGVDASVVETFPTFSYSEVKDHNIGKGALECAVCLNEFGENETLRLLPKCDHVFHQQCIDAWLESHVTCPVCRANLIPQPGDERVQVLESTDNNNMERSNSRTDEIVVQVDEIQNQAGQGSTVSRNSSLEYPNRPPRSWSIRRPKVFGFGKFKSHSTGHSLVQPGANLERFTLRLPEEVRKEVLDRATLNRARSCATTLPREGSARRGYRTGGGEGGIRSDRPYWRIERSDRETESDRRASFMRGLSMRSSKVVAAAGEAGESSRTPVRMPSLKCLEAKAADEVALFSDEPGRPPV